MPRPWDRLAPKETLRLQEALLRDFVRRYLYPFSPYYRDLFDRAGVKPGDIRRLEDLERVPLTPRESFDANGDPRRPFRALLRPDERSLRRWAHRSLFGRMVREKLLRGDEAAERAVAEEFKPLHVHVPLGGGPVVGYTMRDLVAMSQAGARLTRVMDVARSDVLLSTLPFGSDLPFWFTYYAAQASGMSAVHLGAGQAVRPSQVALWMSRIAASVFVTQPGYAEGLLRAAPATTFRSLHRLVLWGATGMQGARARFTALLRGSGASGARVTTVLSVPEARVAWGECPSPAGQPELSYGYHTYPDLEVVEVVDPASGEVVDEGEPGEIVYSSLDWRGSALLRFRTGLYTRQGMVRSRCPGCGRTVPRIGADISRVAWRAGGPAGAGTAVDLADVAAVLWGATDVPLWQLDVARGAGVNGEDVVTALVAGGSASSAADLQRLLAPYRVRVRAMPFQDLRRRLGVGVERLEQRVLIRTAG